MSLDATGAKYFYHYTNTDSLPQHKIWTQLPSNIAKIRVGAILAVTAYFFRVALKTPIIKGWCWPVAILGMSLAAYISYRHLLTKDPLVETFYKIAGGKENYEKLPEIPLENGRKTYENFKMAWASLEHPAYRSKKFPIL